MPVGRHMQRGFLVLCFVPTNAKNNAHREWAFFMSLAHSNQGSSMKKFLAAVLASSCAIAVPASAATFTLTLNPAGKLGDLNLLAGQSAEVLLPAAVGCIDFGIYERSFTNVNSTVDVVGGGYKRSN